LYILTIGIADFNPIWYTGIDKNINDAPRHAFGFAFQLLSVYHATFSMKINKYQGRQRLSAIYFQDHCSL
jgi:hypothetical protein